VGQAVLCPGKVDQRAFVSQPEIALLFSGLVLLELLLALGLVTQHVVGIAGGLRVGVDVRRLVYRGEDRAAVSGALVLASHQWPPRIRRTYACRSAVHPVGQYARHAASASSGEPLHAPVPTLPVALP